MLSLCEELRLLFHPPPRLANFDGPGEGVVLKPGRVARRPSLSEANGIVANGVERGVVDWTRGVLSVALRFCMLFGDYGLLVQPPMFQPLRNDVPSCDFTFLHQRSLVGVVPRPRIATSIGTSARAHCQHRRVVPGRPHGPLNVLRLRFSVRIEPFRSGPLFIDLICLVYIAGRVLPKVRVVFSVETLAEVPMLGQRAIRQATPEVDAWHVEHRNK
mmetsp:Transcript_33246/g.55743  ORF Transcript_33246/g.55743 Transcript_33246/m.55743 type:complete len:216 (+) Transcript_33246:508-1155(+)